MSVRTRSALNPGSMSCTRTIARIRRPDPISRTTDTATSSATSTVRSRFRRPLPRVPSRRAVKPVPPPTRRAGRSPKPSPVSADSVAAIANTRRSTLGCDAIGNVVGTRRARSGTASTATRAPAIPPIRASDTDSVNIWRISRSRPAPNADRTASSRSLEAARANSRLAMLAHVSSSMQRLAPQSASSIIR